jgi:hypothetical protein
MAIRSEIETRGMNCKSTTLAENSSTMLSEPKASTGDISREDGPPTGGHPLTIETRMESGYGVTGGTHTGTEAED